MDDFPDPITWSRNFDDEEIDDEEQESFELPKVDFVVRQTRHHFPSLFEPYSLHVLAGH